MLEFSPWPYRGGAPPQQGLESATEPQSLNQCHLQKVAQVCVHACVRACEAGAVWATPLDRPHPVGVGIGM